MKTKIYTLCDENGEVRYVGKTCKSLRLRLAGHLSEARKGIVTHKCCWIRSMLDCRLIPIIGIIVEVDGNGVKEEIEYIAQFRKNGMNLVNGTDGGDGNPNPSVETRRKMSERKKGKQLSEETKRKISLIKKGHIVSDETREKIREHHLSNPVWNKGKCHSKETLEKMSKSHMGHNAWNKGESWSDEVKLKIGKGNKGKGRPRGFKHTDEFKNMMSGKLKGRDPWNTGCHLSDEHKEKIRVGNLGRIPWNKGKVMEG